MTTIHRVTPMGGGRTTCCNRPVFELPATDQLAFNDEAVTCDPVPEPDTPDDELLAKLIAGITRGTSTQDLGCPHPRRPGQMTRLAWLRRQFTGWPPEAIATVAAVLILAPAAGFLYGDGTHPEPHPPRAAHVEAPAPSSTTTTVARPTATTTTQPHRARQQAQPTASAEPARPAVEADHVEAPQPPPPTTTPPPVTAPPTTIAPTTTTTVDCATHTYDQHGNCIGAPDH